MFTSSMAIPWRSWLGAVALGSALAAWSACGGNAPRPAADKSADAARPPEASAAAKPADDAAALQSAESSLPPSVLETVAKPFTGDLEEMVKRRVIRLGVTYNRTFYFIDKGVQRGAVYEYGKLFEDELNAQRKTGNLKINVIFVPLPRDTLGAALIEGRVDAVIAQVTITADKQKLVDFTTPTRSNVTEVIVTGPGSPSIASVSDLSGKDVYVRKDGTYHQSLLAVNETLKSQGKAPVRIQFAPGDLEDDDLLEMVNAGLIPAIVVDDYLADFWKKIFTNITVHDTVTVRTGGELAIAIRKNSPQLKAALNAFLARNGLGSAFRNIMEKRYLENTKFAKNAASEAERKKFMELVKIFKKYGAQYDVDYLLMGAQGFQESGLDQNAKSAVGAVGVMQLMPATGKEQKVGDINKTDANIHAGVKYMRFMMDQYFKNEPMDKLNKGLFTFASYNAGPGRISQLRKEAATRGLDPNVWFGNVEQVVSERIGRETVTYVSNIYKYYIAYKLIVEQNARRSATKQVPAR